MRWGRAGSPLIRYRTGDLVKMRNAECGMRNEIQEADVRVADTGGEARNKSPGFDSAFRIPHSALEGGILGRTDDMIHVRGNNLYPAALEAVIRRFPEVAEFRIVVDQRGPLPKDGGRGATGEGRNGQTDGAAGRDGCSGGVLPSAQWRLRFAV